MNLPNVVVLKFAHWDLTYLCHHHFRMMSTLGKRRGQFSNLCFLWHLLHEGKGRGSACAAVTRTFFRETSSPSSSVDETLMRAHFVDCSGYINKYIDKCPSIVTKEFSLTMHPKCSLSKAAHLGYITYISLCSLVGSLETSSSLIVPPSRRYAGCSFISSWTFGFFLTFNSGTIVNHMISYVSRHANRKHPFPKCFVLHLMHLAVSSRNGWAILCMYFFKEMTTLLPGFIDTCPAATSPVLFFLITTHTEVCPSTVVNAFNSKPQCSLSCAK